MNNQTTPVKEEEIEKLANDYAWKEYGNYETTSLEGRIKISVAKKSFKAGYAASTPSSEDNKNWMQQFKENWFRDNNTLSKKELNELWKETERTASMAYQYIRRHVESLLATPSSEQGSDAVEFAEWCEDDYVRHHSGNWVKKENATGAIFARDLLSTKDLYKIFKTPPQSKE